MTFLSNYNLSPQGDGNVVVMVVFTLSINYNLSPQGDGNVVALRVLSNNGNITTYPRKGTVTYYARLI